MITRSYKRRTHDRIWIPPFGDTCQSVTAAFAAIYNDDKSDKLCVVLDFGGNKTATNGTFTVSYPNPSTPANAIISMA